MPVIPINIDDLVSGKTVEKMRLEFKNGLNSPQTLQQITATISAFANDFHNLNGGYIILGIAEDENGVAELPPVGIAVENLDIFHKKIHGQCNRIAPEYYPVIEPVDFQDKKILVIWCPAGEARPYKAPKVRGEGYSYHIRQGSQTVEAKGQIEEELLRLTARIPFDDRAATHLDYERLDPSLIKRFLFDTRSKLADVQQSLLDNCLDLRIVRKLNGHYAPLNVSLLFFTNIPHEYLAGAKSEMVQFGDDAGGNLLEEKSFQGPINEQIKNLLSSLSSGTTLVQKLANQAEAIRAVAFPYDALEEAIVNAFYHRSYENNSVEPVKIYLYPDRMEIISYPGPMPGIKPEHLQEGVRLPPVANRNRRIGDFLKQLKLAEMRNTGIPTIFKSMKQNGSPAPRFDFDEDRSYFRVTLPAHPRYVVLHSIREAAYLWTTGQKSAALNRLQENKLSEESGAVYAQLIEYKAAMGDITGAESEWRELSNREFILNRNPAARAMAQGYLNSGDREKALQILGSIQPVAFDAQELTDLAVLYKNSNDLGKAHELFQRYSETIAEEPRALNEFADVKLKLAREAHSRKPFNQRNADTNRRLLLESSELYRRVIQLSSDNVRTGWCWFRLAEIFQHLKKPQTDIESAFRKALQFLPNEYVVKEQFDIWQNRSYN